MKYSCWVVFGGKGQVLCSDVVCCDELRWPASWLCRGLDALNRHVSTMMSRRPGCDELGSPDRSVGPRCASHRNNHPLRS